MPFAAAVKFKPDGAPKYYNPHDLGLAIEDFCIVRDEAIGAERVGLVSCLEGRAAVQMPHLPRVLRRATDAEVEEWYELKIQEKEMLAGARERIEAHNLAIKIIELSFIPDKRQLQIHFSADGRIDFRELVRDLSGRFRARVEMWQVGARKAAGMLDGIGICGQKLCCSCWLKDFPTVSMRHAKDQDIIQPPSKLSGPCGRLRCCLRYEHEMYVDMNAQVPARGCTGSCGVVVDRNILMGQVTVEKEGSGRKVMTAADFMADPEYRPIRSSGGRGRRMEEDDEGDSDTD